MWAGSQNSLELAFKLRWQPAGPSSSVGAGLQETGRSREARATASTAICAGVWAARWAIAVRARTEVVDVSSGAHPFQAPQA